MDPLRRAVADLAALVAGTPDEAFEPVARRFCRLLGKSQLHSDTVMELLVDVIVLDEDAAFLIETRTVIFSLVEMLMCAGEWSQLTALAQILMAISVQDGISDDWKAGAAVWMGLAISPLTVAKACEHLPVLHPARMPWLPEFVAHYTNHRGNSFGRLHFLPMPAESHELLGQVLAALGLRNPEDGHVTETPAGMATRSMDLASPHQNTSPIQP